MYVLRNTVKFIYAYDNRTKIYERGATLTRLWRRWTKEIRTVNVLRNSLLIVLSVILALSLTLTQAHTHTHILPLSFFSLGSYLVGSLQLYRIDDVKAYLLARVDQLKKTVKLSSSIGRSDRRRTAENIAGVIRATWKYMSLLSKIRELNATKPYGFGFTVVAPMMR